MPDTDRNIFAGFFVLWDNTVCGMGEKTPAKVNYNGCLDFFHGSSR